MYGVTCKEEVTTLTVKAFNLIIIDCIESYLHAL